MKSNKKSHLKSLQIYMQFKEKAVRHMAFHILLLS